MPLNFNTGDKSLRSIEIKNMITCGPRCPCVRFGESAAVQSLPKGAEASIQRAKGFDAKAPEKNF